MTGSRRAAPRMLRALYATVALVATGCGFSLQSLPKIGGISGSTYPVHAVFADVLNLPANAQVRVGAQVVGEVTGISAKDFAAEVVLSIKKGVQLPVGTTAEVRFDNPLGDEYVLLRPPASPGRDVLLAGSTVPNSLTSTAPSVEDTFGALSLVLNGGGINQLQTVVHELNNTFTGNQPQIHALLGDINTAVTNLAGGRQAVDNALSSIQGLSAQLNGGSSIITAGIDTVGPAITQLSQANQGISSLLSSLQTLSATGIQVAQQSGQNSVNDLGALLPVVQQLESVDNVLQPDLQTLQQFEAQTPKIAPGDYLQVSVVANIILPPGPSTATPGSTGFASLGTPGAPDPSGSAVSTLLGGGLL